MSRSASDSMLWRYARVSTIRPGTLLLLAAALSGCQTAQDKGAQQDKDAQSETHWYQAVVEQPLRDTDRALKYYQRLLETNAPEFAEELVNKRRSFEQDKTELDRLQLAMLLSFPGTGFRDDNAAIALLQPLARGKEGANSSLRSLAALLYNGLADLRRAEEVLQQQAGRLKEEQRRADALQNKLEALLEMEMRMLEREQASPPKNR